jgi:hypothetical protein
MKNILFKALPHAIAILLFIAISVAYFSPVMDGYSLKQGDIENWKGMSKEIVDYRMLHNGEEPLWTDAMFGGMPAYQVSTMHPSNIFKYCIVAFRFGLPGPVGILFSVLLGGYLMGLFLRIRPWVSILLGLAIGLSTVNILYLGAGHTAKVAAIGFIAPMVGAMIYAMRSRTVLGWAAFAFFFGCQITCNHLQMTYYAGILLALIFVFEWAKQWISGSVKTALMSLAFALVAAVVAVLPNASNLMTTYEYSQYTTRGKSDLTISSKKEQREEKDQQGLSEDYILDYNYNKGERWSIWFPNACGGSNGYFKMSAPESVKGVKRDIKPIVEMMDPYWGGQSSSGGAFYFGWVAFVLAVFALFFVQDILRWPLLIVSILALALSVNEMTPINDFFIHHFPMYKKFRDSKMILMLLPIAWAALAGLMLEKWMATDWVWDTIKKKWMIVSGAMIALVLLLMAQPSLVGNFEGSNLTENITNRLVQFQVIKNPNQITPQELNLVDQVSDEVIKARQVMFSADVQRGLLFLCLVIAVFFVGLKYNKFKWPALALLALIIMGDQWSVCRRYLNSDKEKGKYMRYVKAEEMVVPAAPTAADLLILDKESKLVNAASFESKKGEILSKMNEESEWKKFKNGEVKGQIASFAALNLSSHYRVLTLQNPFSNADVSYLHKSIGGYHGAKLKRYQELIEFCIQPEMERMVDSLRKVGMNYNFKSTPVLNMLNTKYITYSAENPPLENRNACGAAWFVGKVNQVKSANEEILALQSMDTRNEAVVNEAFSKAFSTSGKDSLDSVHLLEYSPNKLTYESKSKNAGAIVFSEIYYPKGWICTVDGQPVETAQVNFVLRGIQVPAGKHEIVWSFEPEVWKTSTQLSGLGSGLMLLMLLGGIFIERKNRMKVAE